MNDVQASGGIVAVVLLDQPPVNSLGRAVRRAVHDRVAQAVADPAVVAIVLAGAGRVFSGGADIREFGSPDALAEPDLRQLIAFVEACQKPVVAAIHGLCMGGGLELALACHWRVVQRGTDLALPEVKLGLLPGAGGTQRLPRAIGVAASLEMIVTGNPVKSDRWADPAAQRLVDRLVDGDPIEAARAFAQQIAAVRPLPRLRDVAAVPDPAALQAARARLQARGPALPAPARCIDAVEVASAQAFEQGLATERAMFAELMATHECHALRHAFFAERAAGKVDGLSRDGAERPIATAAVVGGGTMGSGIAVTLLNAGLPVTLLETSGAALTRGLTTIHNTYQGHVDKGKLQPAQMAHRLEQLRGSLDMADAASADLVIEAVYEELAVKEAVFRRLDTVLKPGAILATNTSTLDVNRLAAMTKRPQDVLGLHFFSPAPVMKLLEVVRADATSDGVLATALALARRIGKTAVVSRVGDGFIGNRMLAPYVRQAAQLLEEGCTPAQVDGAIERFGFAMGPFRVGDLAGNDIGWAIRQRREREQPGTRPNPLADQLCKAGRFGQKTGGGWYDYAAGSRDPQPSPVVQQMIERHRADAGITARTISDEEIVERLVLSLVNEGIRLLEEGIAARAGDIDVVYLTGYGFPRFRGGPLWYAESLGWPAVVNALRHHACNPLDDAAFWQPAPLLQRLVAERGSLYAKTGTTRTTA